MPGLVKGVGRKIPFNSMSSFPGLFGLGRKIPDILFTCWNGAEPLQGQLVCPAGRNVARKRYNSFPGIVMPVEEATYILNDYPFYMSGFHPYCRPAVWMPFVCQGPEMEHCITIRLIEIPLLEFFYYNVFLDFQFPFREIRGKHPVGFKPEGCFYIRRR